VIREIIIWPDTCLKRKSEAVKEFGDELRTLLDDMEQTMRAAHGAGLAAVQLGFPLRCITVLVESTDPVKMGEPRQCVKIVNPVITAREGKVTLTEGCLSLPGYFEKVERSKWVRVEAQDEHGAKLVIEGDGKLAHALQHEIDHLDGIVFTDHISMLKRSLAATKFKKAKAKGMKYQSDRPEPKDFTQLPS
jgi:peptide deformylase